MSMSGTEREPESTAPDVSAVTGLRPGESSTSTMVMMQGRWVGGASSPSSSGSPAAAEAKPSLRG